MKKLLKAQQSIWYNVDPFFIFYRMPFFFFTGADKLKKLR